MSEVVKGTGLQRKLLNFIPDTRQFHTSSMLRYQVSGDSNQCYVSRTSSDVISTNEMNVSCQFVACHHVTYDLTVNTTLRVRAMVIIKQLISSDNL